VGREHTGLDFQHSAVTHAVAVDRVRNDGGFSLLVRLEESLAAGLGDPQSFLVEQRHPLLRAGKRVVPRVGLFPVPSGPVRLSPRFRPPPFPCWFTRFGGFLFD